MGMFNSMRKPRGFNHQYIYVDERKEKLAKMEENAKRDLGMLYQEVYPLDPGYQFRLEFYRLYYLMVHLDKFGMGYAGSVAAVMDRILDACQCIEAILLYNYRNLSIN